MGLLKLQLKDPGCTGLPENLWYTACGIAPSALQSSGPGCLACCPPLSFSCLTPPMATSHCGYIEASAYKALCLALPHPKN